MDKQSKSRGPKHLIVELECGWCGNTAFPPIAVESDDLEAFEEGLKTWKCTGCMTRGSVIVVSKEVDDGELDD